MTAKEYLGTIRALDIKIGQRLSELDELQEIATSIGSFDYSKDRVQTSPSGDAPYTRTAEKVIEVDEDIRRLVDQKEYIVSQIRSLDDPRYIDILYKRYVEYKNFDIISKEMAYHWHYVYQLHTDALTAFEEKFVNNLKKSEL